MPELGDQKDLTANRILVIDDDPLITKILEKGLMQYGYTVSIARHGTDASYLILEFKPDLVVLDVMLPDIDGEEICKRIRSHAAAKNLKIISISAVASPEKIKAMHAAGINLFMPKPFVISEVVEKIHGLIGPIRKKEHSSWKMKGGKFYLLLSLAMIALGVATFFIVKHLLAPKIPEPLTKLEALAEALREHDPNADGEITSSEWDDGEAFTALDHDENGRLNHADGHDDFKALSQLLGTAITRDLWLDKGGEAIHFTLLDRNDNETLDNEDFIVDSNDGNSEASDLISAEDPRSKRQLLLDPLQQKWFKQIVEEDRRGYLRWRGHEVPRVHLLDSTYGRIVDESGRLLAMGFVRERLREGYREVYDAQGEKRRISLTNALGETRFIKLGNTPEVEWLERYTSIRASDTESWSELALATAKHEQMRPEAKEAAKRALIYDRTRSELYEVAGVELVKGRLVSQNESE